MSSNRGSRSTLLQPAIVAARRALERLESDEVPAAVRRVAAHTGGRLPPPLARKLVEELDASGWLRGKALEEFGEPDADADDPARAASSLFLARPERWWAALAALDRAEVEQVSGEEQRRLETELAAAEDRLAETQRRLKAVTDERDDARRETKERVEAERQRLAAGTGEQRARLTEAEAELAEMGRLLEAQRRAHSEVEGHVHRLRGDLLKARRERAEAVRRLGAGARGSAGREPAALARSLDDLAARARPLVGGEPISAAGVGAHRLDLPAGVAPDQAAALDWLAGLDEPFVLLVDGYNVAYQISPDDATSSLGRQRVNVAVARLALRLRSGSPVVVVYDSGLEGERSSVAAARGVEVVFAGEGRLADEEIVLRAAAAAVPAVVVSTDREVREEAAAAGALPLWSEALVEWLRRPS